MLCAYDNPITNTRQLWRDGVLIVDYPKSTFSRRLTHQQLIRMPELTRSLKWEDGQMVGDENAVPSNVVHI